MILKNRGENIITSSLEALHLRLPQHHAAVPKIQTELTNRRSGDRGEKSIDYHLTFLPQNKYLIIHNLRLQNEHGYHFQMDTLLLSTTLIILIDIKNMGGVIRLDKQFNQLVQTLNGQQRGMQDPISQVHRQKSQLERWLKNHHIEAPPIVPLVVMSNPAAIIETDADPSLIRNLTHIINLEGKIDSMEQSYGKKSHLSQKQITKAANLLINCHKPAKYNPLGKFHVDPSDILAGVSCPKCGALPMERIHGAWKCHSCLFQCKKAHAQALRDYRLLFGHSISNLQIRQFLKLSSRHVAKFIARSMNLASSGHGKSKKYFI